MNLNNIGFSLPSFLFTIIILIIYVKKMKKKESNDYIFFVIMCIICIIGILEITLPFAIMNVDKMPVATEIISKLFLSFIAIWQFAFVVYVDVLIYKEPKIKKGEWNRIITYAISIIWTMFLIIKYIFIDLEYSDGINNSNFALMGPPVFYMYAGILLISLYILTYLNINKERIKNIYLKPIVITIVSYFLIITLQIVNNFELNEITFFGSLLVAIIYFTIESQDLKLLNEFKELKDQAEKEDKAKTAYLVNMSHEIRTPLNTIIGFAQLIHDEENFTKENFQKDLKNITDASETLSSLINNILDISTIENNKQEISERDYILDNLVFEINSTIPAKIRNDEVRFTIDINQDIPREYNGDIYKIYKSLTYILLNAIDNTSFGEIKLEIDGEKVEDGIFELKFTIYNTGHSMSHENFNSNYDDFVRLQSSGEGNLNNIRLGFIIAKELIAMLNGSIEFINKKSQGTRYIVKIKQKIVNETPIGNIFENVDIGMATTRNLLYLPDKTALVVDDGDVNLKMAKKSLEQYGLNILLVNSGKECIEVVKNQKIDVIFMDHMMPEMDGIATIKALNSIGCEVPPIVALTANNYDALKNEYIAHGFNDYLHKPIVFKELNRVMKKLFGPEEE